jgi:RNA polymerase sigma-70 factor (ECF subfamily)
MSASDENGRPSPADAGRFATTRWSVVLAAGQGESREALATLCATYWYPLYAFARRHLASAEDAQDLTQEFFSRLLEKKYLRVADRERGKFRSFLLTAFKHFLAKERERNHAQKRGGGRHLVPLDFGCGESRYSLEPAHEWTADRIYERRWALTLLDQVLARLRDEFVKADKLPLFDCLKVLLPGERGSEPYAQIAADFQMTEGAVKVAVHRLRQRYRELLRAEIAQTVGSPGEVDDELRQLFAALRLQKA